MKVIKDEKLIKRNGKIGEYTLYATLGLFGLALFLSFEYASRTDLFTWSLICMTLGIFLSQISMHFTTRWGRSPRPDERLDSGLKGLPNEDVIYHYVTPVSHLYIGGAGIWVLHPLPQRGHVTYQKNRWKLSGGGFVQGYLSIFGQERLGRPDLEIESEVDTIKRYLLKKLDNPGDIPINGALVFTNDLVEIEPNDTPIPALKLKQLKEFMRQKSREKSSPTLMVEKIKGLLGDGQ